MAPFGTVLTAMITPFTADGAVDHEAAWRLARHLVDNGSDGLVVTGTTGESPTLSDEEKAALWRTVVDAVGGRAKVVAGTGTYDTAHSVELGHAAAEAGVDGHMAVTPYYSKPSQRGLLAHFSTIADAVDLPLVIYNIPGRTARLIEVDTLAELSRHPRIVAVKDAVESLDFTMRSRAAMADDVAIYSGSDHLTLPMQAVGAIGVISVASHLAGRQIARMVAAANEGDVATARDLHYRLLPLFKACFLEPNPAPVKAAMDRLWGPVGPPRLPLVPASADTVAAIEEALGALQEVPTA